MSWLLRTVTATLWFLALFFDALDPGRLTLLAWLTWPTALYCAVLAFRQGSKAWADVLLTVGVLYSPVRVLLATSFRWQPLLGLVVAVVFLYSLKPIADPRDRLPLAKGSFFVGALLVLVSYIGIEHYWFTRLVTISIQTTAFVVDVREDAVEYDEGARVADVAVYRCGATVARRGGFNGVLSAEPDANYRRRDIRR